MQRYSNRQILFHWASFVLILAMAGSGLAYSFDLADKGAMIFHQIAGQILIVVLALRLITRFTTKVPTAAKTHAKWEQVLAHIVHIGLYLVMIAFVVTGYVAASGEIENALLAPISLTFARSDTGEALLDMHYMLKWALLTLFALHLAGALKHAVIDRDKTLSRMTFSSAKD